MEYTVKQLAALAGVTARTLRWYDKEGLLAPLRITAAGYRIYGSAQVDRLQHILFYRELGLELNHIRRLLDAPAFDRQTALQSHLAALMARRERLDSLILTVTKTLDDLRGEQIMTDHEKFEGFKQKSLHENEEKYGKEIRVKYGEETVTASNKLFQNLNEAQFNEMSSIAAELQARLEQAVTARLDPTGEEGLSLAALHRRWLGFTWPSYSLDAHRGLGELYVADERFTTYYDGKVPGCAAFLCSSIAAYTAAP